MNHSRYLAYRHTRELLESEGADGLDPEERELMRDMAEQMLLTRAADADDADEVSHGAALALRTLAARGDISRSLASELWEEICAAGPDPYPAVSPPFPEPVSAVLRTD